MFDGVFNSMGYFTLQKLKMYSNYVKGFQTGIYTGKKKFLFVMTKLRYLNTWRECYVIFADFQRKFWASIPVIYQIKVNFKKFVHFSMFSLSLAPKILCNRLRFTDENHDDF